MLTELAGRDAAGLSSDDVLKLIARQKGLNNAPGEAFVYSNSNYFLLGLVIKRATGKTLAEYANEHIFLPLGMKNTLFYDNKSIVVPNRVAAYEPGKDGGFSVDWSTQFDLVGSGGLMGNVDDLLLWDLPNCFAFLNRNSALRCFVTSRMPMSKGLRAKSPICTSERD